MYSDCFAHTQRTVRRVALEAGIDLLKLWHELSPEDLLKVYAGVRMFSCIPIQPLMCSGQSRAKCKYLARFENDWATADILRQYMQNQRKQERRKAVTTPNDDDAGEQELDLDELMGYNGEDSGDDGADLYNDND